MRSPRPKPGRWPARPARSGAGEVTGRPRSVSGRCLSAAAEHSGGMGSGSRCSSPRRSRFEDPGPGTRLRRRAHDGLLSGTTRNHRQHRRAPEGHHPMFVVAFALGLVAVFGSPLSPWLLAAPRSWAAESTTDMARDADVPQKARDVLAEIQEAEGRAAAWIRGRSHVRQSGTPAPARQLPRVRRQSEAAREEPRSRAHRHRAANREGVLFA